MVTNPRPDAVLNRVGGDGSCLGQGRLSLSFRRVSYDVEELIEIIRVAAELTLRLW